MNASIQRKISATNGTTPKTAIQARIPAGGKRCWRSFGKSSTIPDFRIITDEDEVGPGPDTAEHIVYGRLRDDGWIMEVGESEGHRGLHAS
jgi:hypothetical protein